ncbi:unnamed protein product [Sphagnum balticum]
MEEGSMMAKGCRNPTTHFCNTRTFSLGFIAVLEPISDAILGFVPDLFIRMDGNIYSDPNSPGSSQGRTNMQVHGRTLPASCRDFMNPVANIAVAVFVGLKNRVGFLGQTPQQPKGACHPLTLPLSWALLLPLAFVRVLITSFAIALFHVVKYDASDVRLQAGQQAKQHEILVPLCTSN